MKTIITHNGVFHADEIAAIAMLLIKYEKFSAIRIKRTRDQKEIESAYIAVDVGGIYDTENLRFDHHQDDYSGELSSAGMVWKYFSREMKICDCCGHMGYNDECLTCRGGFGGVDEDNYLGIPHDWGKKLISEIDAQDTGVKRQGPNHFCNVIAGMNQPDVYSHQQEVAFTDALKLAMKYLQTMDEKLLADQKAINDENKAMLEANRAEIAGKATITSMNGVKFASVKEWIPTTLLIGKADFMVSWDKGQNCWSVQQIPLKSGEFGGKFKLVSTGAENEIFVHKAGFIGKYKDLKINIEGQKEVQISL